MPEIEFLSRVYFGNAVSEYILAAVTFLAVLEYWNLLGLNF